MLKSEIVKSKWIDMTDPGYSRQVSYDRIARWDNKRIKCLFLGGGEYSGGACAPAKD